MPDPTYPLVACPTCSRRYRWKEEFAGKQIVCVCGTKFLLPAAQDAPASALPPSPPPTTASPTPPPIISAPVAASLGANDVSQLLQADLSADASRADDPTLPSLIVPEAPPNLCPFCGATWRPGGTFCFDCGYTPEPKPNPYDLNLVHLRDERIRAIVFSGLSAIICSAIWGRLYLAYRTSIPPSVENLNLPGALSILIALITCQIMSRHQRSWSRLLQACAWLFTVTGILIGHVGGYGWLDLAWIPLALLLTHHWGTSAHKRYLRRSF